MHCVLLKVYKQTEPLVLLMDNTGCHPQDLSGKYSNIKILFLPPSSSALDLGIIKNFKIYYCKLLMLHVLAKIEEHSSAHEVANQSTSY